MDEDDCGHLYGFADPAAKPSKLQEIVKRREQDVLEGKQLHSESELRKAASAFVRDFGPPRSLVDCLSAAEASPWSIALAAEFKRASPSKGDINAGLDAAVQALEYAKVGASILSVLTEPTWFKGSLQDLQDVRKRTQGWAEESHVDRPCCLRKDFLVDEYQVLEAVANGADTVLLMVSILSKSKLKSLIQCCRDFGMEPLVEVVTPQELKVALSVGAKVLGVNNRDLHTFELCKSRTADVAKLLKETYQLAYGPGSSTKLLALSGLSSAEDVQQCRELSCSGVLVGEALMRATDVAAAIRDMMGEAIQAALPVPPGSVVVKVCGVRRSEDAAFAIAAGANLIGVIFAKSKRQATLQEAQEVVETVRKFGERSQPILAPQFKDLDENASPESFSARSAALRSACRSTPLVVGVFMDQSLEDVVEAATRAGVDAVQLHGREDVAFIKELRSKIPGKWVFKVLHIPAKSETQSGEELSLLRASLASFGSVSEALLLDTSVKGQVTGGTGEAFDWDMAKRTQDEWGYPVIVAGGLTASNVGDLVSSISPFGVDVASGVEDAPGVKNREATSAYVHRAKRARAER